MQERSRSRSRSPETESKVVATIDVNLPGVLHKALVHESSLAVDVLEMDLVKAHLAPIECILDQAGIGKSTPVDDPWLGINWFEFFEAKFGALALANAGVELTPEGTHLERPAQSVAKMSAYLTRFDTGVDNAGVFHDAVRQLEDEQYQNDLHYELEKEAKHKAEWWYGTAQK